MDKEYMKSMEKIMDPKRRKKRLSPETRKKIIKYVWGAIPVVFLLFMVVMLGFVIVAKMEENKLAKEKALKKEQPPVNVVALELVPSLIRDRINLPGIVEPWVKLKMMAEVSGKIVQKVVTEGDMVQKGDVIARIDQRDYQNGYNSARASFNAARASLKRLKGLYKDQLATRSQLDDAQANMENMRAAMDNAALSLERCTIAAPISGMVNNLMFEKGQYMNVGDPVAEILQMDQVKVQVGIPESDVDAVRKLEDFQIKIDALEGKTYSAKKHFLSRTADDDARLYRLELALDNPDGEILPDMFVRIDIIKREVKASLSVPLYSVITRNNEQYVYIVNDTNAHVKKVELGLLEGWRIQIKSGLKPGQKVIVVGHRSVNDGDPVNVVRQVKNAEDIIQ